MLNKTNGIVLRTTKYGETSLIVAVYTELFGLQSYMVKGVRQAAKKSASNLALYQPAAILEMVVYHNELKQLQFIKECKWFCLYKNIGHHVVKNCVALFMVELLTKSMKQPEGNQNLYAFIKQNLLMLDEADVAVVANLPLHFALHLAHNLGFGILPKTEENQEIVDLHAGIFTKQIPQHGAYLAGQLAMAMAQLLTTQQAISLYQIKLNRQQRQQLMLAIIQFYQYHITDFGQLKTLDVLEAVLA